MKRLIELLHSEGCSCVIESQGEIRHSDSVELLIYTTCTKTKEILCRTLSWLISYRKRSCYTHRIGKDERSICRYHQHSGSFPVTGSRYQNLVRKRSAIYHQSYPDRKMSAGITLCRTRHGRRNLSDNRKICSTNKNYQQSRKIKT